MKPRADKTQCRYCKLKAPAVAIACIKGKPQGECLDCKRNRQLRHRLQSNFHLGLYRSIPDLVAVNLKTLKTLGNGTYSLIKTTDKAQVGYIIVKNDTILVNVYKRCDLFHYELFGIASYLGNLNVFLEPCEASGNITAIDASALVGLEPIDVQERLIWYDLALQAKAIKIIREEVSQAKRSNMALARMIIASSKTVQKTPSEKP